MWNFLDLSVEFRSGGLVESDGLFQSGCADGVEHSEDTDSITVGCVFWHIKTDLHVGHGSEIIDFGGLGVGGDGDEIGGIAKITVMQEDLDAGLVAVLVNVLDTAGVKTRGSSHDSVDL